MTEVYCITGYPGAGKTVVADIAEEYGAEVVSMGDEVRARNDTDEHTGVFATEMREQHGQDIVARWTADKIEGLDADTVVVEGVRSLDELEYFQQYFDEFTLILVNADDSIRLKRLQDRGREDEDEFDMDALQERDEREESWGLAELIEDGDYETIVNNHNTRGPLEEKVRETMNL